MPPAPYDPLRGTRCGIAAFMGFLACIPLVNWLADSIAFLAFGSLEFFPSQLIRKAWAVLIAIPLVRWVAPTPA